MIQLFPLEILDFFNEFFLKVGLGGVNPTGHRHLVLIPVHHAQKLNALLPLRMSP
jgi:hypothetical protein